jgi:cytochrome c biogenesis protein CcdA
MKKDTLFDKEEIKTIAKLLIEYSSKIIQLIDQLNAQRSRIISLSFVLVFTLITILVGSFLLNTNYEIEYLIYYAGGITLAGLFVFLQLFRLETRKFKSIEENIYLLESKLEKLVRKASQIEEHVEIEKGMILELDLKLAEAEGTLRTIQQIRARKKS